MSTHRLINWLLAIAIAMLVAATCNLDTGPDEITAAQAVAADKAEAVQTAQQTARHTTRGL